MGSAGGGRGRVPAPQAGAAAAGGRAARRRAGAAGWGWGWGWSRSWRVRASPRCCPAVSMKVEFAPINIPLKRRIQTIAVLQWIFSFLLLGNSLPPSCPCPRETRERIGFFLNQRHPWASVCVTPRGRKGVQVASGSLAVPGRARASHFWAWAFSSLEALGGFFSFGGSISFYGFFFKYDLKKLVTASSH